MQTWYKVIIICWLLIAIVIASFGIYFAGLIRTGRTISVGAASAMSFILYLFIFLSAILIMASFYVIFSKSSNTVCPTNVIVPTPVGSRRLVAVNEEEDEDF